MSMDATCTACGVPIIRKTGVRYSRCFQCSWEYRRFYRERGRPLARCVNCDGAIPKHHSRFCSQKCRESTPSQRRVCPLIPDRVSRGLGGNTGRDWAQVPYPAVWRPCRGGCGARVYLPYKKRRHRSGFCSGACGAGVRPTLKDLPPLVDRPQPSEVPICEWCDRPFAAGTGRGRKFCSNACENYGRGRASLATVLTYGDCTQCGRLFVRPSHQAHDTCSARCTIRRRKYERRHLKRVKNGGESFTLREVADRDGWRCHLCGKKVPDQEYAARDDDPTLDHLVPVSRGGKHVRSNVALAHNRCNWERSDTPIEFQMRLIA